MGYIAAFFTVVLFIPAAVIGMFVECCSAGFNTGREIITELFKD